MTLRFKFQPQFIDDVTSGRKSCTIRSARKRIGRPGDPVVLEAWSGKPYASPVKTLGHATLRDVLPIVITQTGDRLTVRIDGDVVGHDAIRILARRDGFPDVESFLDFFRPNTPFAGHFYEWEDINPTP